MSVTDKNIMNKLIFIFIFSIIVKVIFVPKSKLPIEIADIKDTLLYRFKLINGYSIIMIKCLLTISIFAYGLIYGNFNIFYNIFYSDPSLLIHIFILIVIGIITFFTVDIIIILLSIFMHIAYLNNFLTMIPKEHSFIITDTTDTYIVADEYFIDIFNKDASYIWMCDLLNIYTTLAKYFQITIVKIK